MVLDAVLENDDLVHEISSPWGTGKTWLLQRLQHSLADQGKRVIYLSVGPEPAPSEEGAHPLAELRYCLNLANAIAEQFPGRPGRRLRRAIETAGKKGSFLPIEINQSIHAGENAVIHAGEAQSVHITAAWSAHVAGLTEALARDVAAAIGEAAPAALLVDDFHHLGYPEVSRWLVSTLERLEKTRVVVAWERDPQTRVLGGRFRAHALRPFSEGEIASYLSQRLGQPASRSLCQLVDAATGRMPWAVALIAEAVAHEPEGRVKDLRRLLGTIDVADRVSHLLDIFFAGRKGAVQRCHLEVLSVPRRFDAELAATLLADSLPDEVTVAEALAEMRRTMLLHSTQEHEVLPTRIATPGHAPEEFSLPTAIQSVIAAELRDRDPSAWRGLHAKVAGHYWEKIIAWSGRDDGGNIFSYWSRFENQTWPRLLTEWIHHVAQSPAGDLSQVRTLVTRWYLEGFFWYEWSVPHWFCERLIDACQELHTAGADTAWLDSLEVLHTTFPRGWQHQASSEQWQRCTDALLKIRYDAEAVQSSPPELANSASQIYAIASHLLGHSVLFQSGPPEQGMRFYTAARQWYVGEQNDWSRTYLDVHEIDLWMRSGDLTRAEDLPGTETAARELNDYEMLTLVIRMEADRLWLTGRREKALGGYLKAIMHALSYQAKQLNLPNINYFPDVYTRELYVEMVTRTTERLDELTAGEKPLADRFAATARHLFAPFWRDAAPDRLFPPPPGPDDLGLEDSDYIRRVRWCVEQRGQVLDADLATSMDLGNIADDGAAE